MNTRKSSPLPNPHDTIARYQIAYKIHYQDLHRHLLTKIYIHEAQKNQILKQFTKLAKNYDQLKKLSLNSSEQLKSNYCQPKSSFDQLKEDEKGIKMRMGILYGQICQKELQINKLYQQCEGILLQLCDMLNSTQQDMVKIRQSNETHNSQIRFLHHQNLLYNINDVNLGKRKNPNKTSKSCSIDKNKSKDMELSSSTEKILNTMRIRSDFTGSSDQNEQISAEITGAFKQQKINQSINEGQQQQGEQRDKKQSLGELYKSHESDQHKQQQLGKINEERDEQFLIMVSEHRREEISTKEQKQTEDSVLKQGPNNKIQSQLFEYSNIQKILNLYQKPEAHSLASKFANSSKSNNVIQISSSLQGSFDRRQMKMNEKKGNQLSKQKSSLNSKPVQSREYKRQKKNKNRIKNCITILD